MSLKIRIVKIYEDNLGSNEKLTVSNYVELLDDFFCRIRFRDRINYCISLKDNREENVKIEKEKVKRYLPEESKEKTIHGKKDIIEKFVAEKIQSEDMLLIECFRMENDKTYDIFIIF